MTDEREAFEAGYRFASFIERTKSGTYRHPSTQCAWEGWLARAEWQRQQDKGLVEALEQITRMTYDEWTNGAVASCIADEALTAHRAAQGE